MSEEKKKAWDRPPSWSEEEWQNVPAKEEGEKPETLEERKKSEAAFAQFINEQADKQELDIPHLMSLPQEPEEEEDFADEEEG